MSVENRSHEQWMRIAQAEAVKAFNADEVPIGAAVVHNQEVIGLGFNQPISSNDPTAHAEIVALRQAAESVGNYRLVGATLYVTAEPCLMCTGSLIHARIDTLVYGTQEPKFGAVSSLMRALDHPELTHRVKVIGGILAEENRELLKNFFVKQRSVTRLTEASIGSETSV